MAAHTEQQASNRGPAQPSFVFRGHTAQIHSARIVSRNTCLATGDADGWVVIWRLETKRALAVWKAHDGAILGTAMWGNDKFITHGRDHNLRIWQLDISDTSTFSKALPAEGPEIDRPKPWLLYSLPVNTLNFCAFSMCYGRDEPQASRSEQNQTLTAPIFIAVPAKDDKRVVIYTFPQEKLTCVVPRVEPRDTGMVMAVKLVPHPPSNNLLIAVGYEGGFIAVHAIRYMSTEESHSTRNVTQIARIIYLSQPHTQPVLSLDVLPNDGTTFFTSSADAVIATHRIKDLPLNDIKSVEIQQVQQEVEFISDKKVEKPDQMDNGAPRPSEPSSSTLNTQHASQSQASTSTLDTSGDTIDFKKRSIPPTTPATNSGVLSSLLSNAPNPPTQAKRRTPSFPKAVTLEPPQKFVNTKHAGQQSLRVRSDGRLLVTGGWDKRVRIYSTKTLKEVAVLKWHTEGVYAVDFGEILDAEDARHDAGTEGTVTDRNDQVVKRETGLGKLQRQREERMQMKHWVVAGAKDGKVSLWEVF